MVETVVKSRKEEVLSKSSKVTAAVGPHGLSDESSVLGNRFKQILVWFQYYPS